MVGFIFCLCLKFHLSDLSLFLMRMSADHTHLTPTQTQTIGIYVDSNDGFIMLSNAVVTLLTKILRFGL